MSTLYIVLILGAINARRSFNEEKRVKQQAILTTKKVRLHEEIRKPWYEEYSPFCWKIWCWGKNLTRKRNNKTKKNNKPEANDEKKTTLFFQKPGLAEFITKWK